MYHLFDGVSNSLLINVHQRLSTQVEAEKWLFSVVVSTKIYIPQPSRRQWNGNIYLAISFFYVESHDLGTISDIFCDS